MYKLINFRALRGDIIIFFYEKHACRWCQLTDGFHNSGDGGDSTDILIDSKIVVL
jgi:hypothetical protein